MNIFTLFTYSLFLRLLNHENFLNLFASAFKVNIQPAVVDATTQSGDVDPLSQACQSRKMRLVGTMLEDVGSIYSLVDPFFGCLASICPMSKKCPCTTLAGIISDLTPGMEPTQNPQASVGCSTPQPRQ